MCEGACEGKGERGRETEWKTQGVRRRGTCVADRTNESKSVGNCGLREVQEHGTVTNEETQEGVVGCQE